MTANNAINSDSQKLRSAPQETSRRQAHRQLRAARLAAQKVEKGEGKAGCWAGR